MRMKRISRKTVGGFNLVSCHPVNGHLSENFCNSLESKNLGGCKDVYVFYDLPIPRAPKLIMIERTEDCIGLDDFEISSRSKRVLELGSGYGLAGFAIAASTDAGEVVISDGNPQVVDYIQRNINLNACVFGNSKVDSMPLHWNQN